MSVLAIIGAAAGCVSLVSSLYVLARYGFRVDELWRDHDTPGDLRARILVLESQVEDLQRYAWRSGEREARVKHAIYDP